MKLVSIDQKLYFLFQNSSSLIYILTQFESVFFIQTLFI